MMQTQQDAGPSKVVKPKSRKAIRFLEKRAPKMVEDAKRVLLLFGNNTSQVVKDVLSDIHRLKGTDSVKYTKKNEAAKPFEAGGEASLEFYCNRGNCSLFMLAGHTKKRPHNLVLGRLYDFHMYDMLELGVDKFTPMKAFPGASKVQAGNKPCMIFVGDKFESEGPMKLAKSMLLDVFRGQEVDNINLAGLDHVVVAVALDSGKLLLRQYAIKLKKSGTKVPRVALEEMGPSMDLSLRRSREAPADLAKEACKKPVKPKKMKNTSTDMLEGKVGRIYMPKQQVDTMALHKMKGLKRERRQAAAATSEARKAKRAKPAAASEEEAE